ncbi:DUF6907 domain-containing protein [Streptomyces sp. NPDC008150]|uniref:DUF6907 domain-containing protein n=1 Tax=Streptomyces sp. NPDC008150 TaxID=3364816 RepID=UPI0036E69366
MQNSAISTSMPVRLVPASVGASTVYVPCPGWCTVDHIVDGVNYVDDILHSGRPAVWNVASFEDGGMRDRPVQLSVELGADLASKDPRFQAAHVTVSDGSVYAYLTPEMADTAADELVAFAARIREAARTARLSGVKAARNQADEALYRVRGGQS